MTDKQRPTLLVDDQMGFHRSFSLCARILRIKNYKLFADSADLLNHAPDDDVKTVLSDWNLIGSAVMHGKLIEKLVTLYPQAKVYVISTACDEKELQEAQDAGASGWIVKTDLIDTMRKWQKEKDTVSEFTVWK